MAPGAKSGSPNFAFGNGGKVMLCDCWLLLLRVPPPDEYGRNAAVLVIKTVVPEKVQVRVVMEAFIKINPVPKFGPDNNEMVDVPL